MEESSVVFKASDGVALEGRVAGELGEEVWVICHPHPQYGGSMNNNVVFGVRDTFLDMGAGTLRFNFRGVGGSEGSFDDGMGEALDVIGAVDFLQGEHDTKRVCVAAYSFGARVFLGAVKEDLDLEKVVLISPPVSFMDFSELNIPKVPTRIIVGEDDEYCRGEDLEKWLETQEERGNRAELTVLPSVDHFYGGAEGLLGDAIRM